MLIINELVGKVLIAYVINKCANLCQTAIYEYNLSDRGQLVSSM